MKANEIITNKEFKDIIREIKTRIAQCNGFNRKHREEVFNLLDSLRPQNTWKPTNEQMDALETAVSSLQSTALESLYQKLNKLM